MKFVNNNKLKINRFSGILEFSSYAGKISINFIAITFVLLLTISSSLAAKEVSSIHPHIIFILADDLGWNDVGFHGSAQIPTPNIDALAYSGIILNRYYVNPICTPSRSALMTGKYPIHTGMQHTVLYGGEPRGLPLTEKILPQYLNELGYSSHIAGKWHLGHYKRIYTPLYRGFKSHLGYWTGHHDYNDHTAMETGWWGLDLRRGLDVPYELHGQYTSDIITNESINVIRNHNKSESLFLYVAHAAVHSGNPYNPLPVSDDVVEKLKHITDNFKRRKYAGMVSKLDDSVGAIVHELDKQNMLSNSIIIFSTDNGGPADGFNLNHASNWPLRGVKNTLWEGGVRGAGLLWSPLLEKPKRVAEQTIHIVDWLPTLLEAISSDLGNLNNTNLDGISIWNELSTDKISPRKEILHNIDDIWGSAALTMGDWKIIKGTNYKGVWDGWYGPPGMRLENDYNINLIKESPAGRAIRKLKIMPTDEEIIKLRNQANINCTMPKNYLLKGTMCEPLTSPCLFNIRDDPCEQFNLAARYPNILKAMISQLEKFNATAIPPSNMPIDPRANPRLWDNTWTNFGDYDNSDSKAQ